VATRIRKDLEAFLDRNGVHVEDNAFELELNSHGWRVAAEKQTRQGVMLWIECAVDCDESIPRNLTVVSDEGTHDRDVALMRALERVIDYGFLREETSA
jgi:hypothetical protein